MEKIRLKQIASFALAPLAAIGLNAADNGAKRPNIIFVLCDDMGYGDIRCYGQPYISTPNLDCMANEGMRFTQAYAGSPVSAPSRACLMTGQHTGHTRVRGNKEYWNAENLNVPYGNNLDYAVVGQEPYVILPEIMKEPSPAPAHDQHPAARAHSAPSPILRLPHPNRVTNVNLTKNSLGCNYLFTG